MAKEQELSALQNAISRICQGTEIVGNVITPGDIRIDGLLDGNINTQGRIVIGATGKIFGKIICRNIDIWGGFEGKLSVGETLLLKESGTITGEIATTKLIVEPGAIFNGSCTMTKEKEEEKKTNGSANNTDNTK